MVGCIFAFVLALTAALGMFKRPPVSRGQPMTKPPSLRARRPRRPEPQETVVNVVVPKPRRRASLRDLITTDHASLRKILVEEGVAFDEKPASAAARLVELPAPRGPELAHSSSRASEDSLRPLIRDIVRRDADANRDAHRMASEINQTLERWRAGDTGRVYM